MIPFHSETQRAVENLQKFWAKGDVTFFKQSVILERSMKAFENEKTFQHWMKELEASWDILRPEWKIITPNEIWFDKNSIRK